MNLEAELCGLLPLSLAVLINTSLSGSSHSSPGSCFSSAWRGYSGIKGGSVQGGRPLGLNDCVESFLAATLPGNQQETDWFWVKTQTFWSCCCCFSNWHTLTDTEDKSVLGWEERECPGLVSVDSCCHVLGRTSGHKAEMADAPDSVHLSPV